MIEVAIMAFTPMAYPDPLMWFGIVSAWLVWCAAVDLYSTGWEV